MNLIGFVIEALSVSYAEEEVKKKLENMGTHRWAAWVIASIGVAGFLKILKDDVLVAYEAEAIEVTFPNSQKRHFNNKNEFYTWQRSQSEEYQTKCLEFWTEWSKNAWRLSSPEVITEKETPWIKVIYKKKSA